MIWQRQDLSRQTVCLTGKGTCDPAEAEALLQRCGFTVRKQSRDTDYSLFGTWTAQSFDAFSAFVDGKTLSLTEALQQALETGILPGEGEPVKSRVRICEGYLRIYLDQRNR